MSHSGRAGRPMSDETKRLRVALRRRRTSAGFSLIETLVVATTLAISVLGLSHIAVSTERMRLADLEKAAAGRALEREIEEIKSTNFTAIQGTYNNTGFSVILEGEAHDLLRPVPGDADGKTGHVAVSVPNPPNDAAKLLEVNVQIDWTGVMGLQHLQRTFRLSNLGAGS